MSDISALRGVGRGKRCLIIGGGMSAANVRIPQGFEAIAVNRVGEQFKGSVKYVIYNDKNIRTHYIDKRVYDDKAIYISNVNAKSRIVRYTYQDTLFKLQCKHPHGGSMNAGFNTGFKALYIAKFIFAYDAIYLAGYDFTMQNGYSHYYGDDIGVGKLYTDAEQFDIAHVSRLSRFVHDFDTVNWGSSIYNLNRHSALRLFPYATVEE